MTTEMHFNIPDNSVLKRLDRFSTKPGIILDRHAPNTSGTLTKDPDGEYIRLKDIQVLLRMGGLFELTDEINEQLLDGAAQRALLRDLESLGYDNFEQVMNILKEHKPIKSTTES